MTDRGISARSLTRRAIQEANDGNVAGARVTLAEALKIDPEYQRAWHWFASISSDDGERKFCLERAAALGEDRAATTALARLTKVKATIPAELEDFSEPPAPASLVSGPPKPPNKLKWWHIASLALIAILAVAGFLYWNDDEGEPVYIALATGMTGSGAGFGEEMKKSIELYLSQINDDGGINGHPVRLLVYDDQDDPTVAAQQAQAIVDDGRAMVVIGHRVSTASIAAAPIYQAAGIVAITPSSTVDSLTAGNPWYFRTIFGNSEQGRMISYYIGEVLESDRASIIYANSDYGQTLYSGFSTAFVDEGSIEHAIMIDGSGEAAQAAIDAAVQEIAGDDNPGPVVLAMHPDVAKPLIIGLRKANVQVTLIGGDSLGDQSFVTSFNDQPEEQAQPGYFTNGLYLAAPLFTDSLTSEAVRWFTQYQDAYGSRPTWRGATAYDAAIAAVYGMQTAEVTGTTSGAAAERQAIQTALLEVNTPEVALPGLSAPIYFDEDQNSGAQVAIGLAQAQFLSSAPVQLRAADVDTPEENMITIGDQQFQQQRIVHVGININEISELDLKGPTFHADFFIWLNFTGDESAAEISFENSSDPSLSVGEPLRSETLDNGMEYRLYRVAGTFKASMNFHEFPFDQQQLTIVVQNRLLPASQVVYSIDRGVAVQTQAERLQSGTNASASINAIPNWNAVSFYFFQNSVGNTSGLGATQSASSNDVAYAQFVADVTIERNLRPFLIKNLLPLGLLVLVTYVSLFFQPSQMGARVSFGITGILTGAVLLTGVTGSLPDVGYTVAIEWGYYAFIFLSLTCMVLGLIGERLFHAKQMTALHRLVFASRVYYPLFVLAVAGVYYFAYR
ncbi:ABC transporter substrate-binding protein [soil metagenome]